MTSLPCYEILGLNRNIEQTSQTIYTAYNRLKDLVVDTQIQNDLNSAYEILINTKSRIAYSLNWTPFNESEWEWQEFVDDDGVIRSLVRKTKKERTQEWILGDNNERKNIKKQKDNDRKLNRNKRRGDYGYD
jgi:hypothetical protein